MALEIERKFFLPEAPPWLREHPATEIEQGYLATGDDAEVRLRRAGTKRVLTAKSGHGEVRSEAEAGIDARQFWAFWPLTGSRRLTKIRYRVPLADLTVEVDVFDGELEGLVLAEIEFESEGQSRAFRPPAWLGREVTGDGRFANQSLAEADRPPDVNADREGRSGKDVNMSNRGQRALSRAIDDRGAQLAAGTVAVASAALASKMGIERLRGNGEQPRPSRAYRLKDDEKPKQGLRRIARARASDAIDELQDADSKGVHDARKDLKKLRSPLRLVRDDLGKDFYRAENRRFRDAGRRLAAPRDATVKAETLESLRQRYEDELDGDLLSRYRDLLVKESEAALETLDGEIVVKSAEAIALGRNRVTGWQLRSRGWKLVGPGLVRSYRRGRKAMWRVASDPNSEDVHQWRKRTKDLWYQLRIMRGAWAAVLESTVGEVHELSDMLGDHHDLAVLAEDIRERNGVLGDGAAVGALLQKVEARQTEHLSQALELGERLYAEKPKAFARRVETYWLGWRPV